MKLECALGALLLASAVLAGSLDRPAYGQTIKADRLAVDYEKNAVLADQRYKGRVFKIGGIVKAIDSDEAVMVELVAPYELHHVSSVRCTFANTAGVAALQVGKPVQVTGTVDGKRGYHVVVINCSL